MLHGQTHRQHSRETNDPVQVASQSDAASIQTHEHLICLTTSRSEQLALNVSCVDHLAKDVGVGNLQHGV